jgi:hypothetical protein
MSRSLALTIGGAVAVLLGQDAPGPALAASGAHVHMPRAELHGASRSAPKAPKAAAPETAAVKPPPAQPFHGLMAADQAEVKTRLGSPDVARGEGAGAMWTYRLPDCALFVFFRGPKGASGDTVVRVSGAASGPRVRGQKPLPVNDCIAQAMNRQTAGASTP